MNLLLLSQFINRLSGPQSEAFKKKKLVSVSGKQIDDLSAKGPSLRSSLSIEAASLSILLLSFVLFEISNTTVINL